MKGIRGSAVGTIPWRVLEIMRESKKPMRSAEILANFPATTRRSAVAFALCELSNKKVIARNGARRSMLYSLTGAEYPVRVPVEPYWKPKASQAVTEKQKERAVKFNLNKPEQPKQKLSIKEELLFGKFKTPSAPKLVECPVCERFGHEKGCKDCRYVSETERNAA